MKPDEFAIPGVIEQAYQLSPEAAKAQMQAELKQMAAYRARRMQAYKDWSSPEAIAARLEEQKKAAPAALVTVVDGCVMPFQMEGPRWSERIKVKEKGYPCSSKKP